MIYSPDIDECQKSPCNKGNCRNLYGSFECSCEAGLMLAEDKITCQGEWL